MITLEPQLEQQLNILASEAGLSTSEFIQNLFLNYQLEQSVLKRAESFYGDHKKTGESVSLDLFECSRPIDYTALKNTDELAFTDIEDAAQYGKQLRSSAWHRNNKHD